MPSERIGTGSIAGSHIANYTITNSDISTSAAISGSKVKPDFRDQPDLTYIRGAIRLFDHSTNECMFALWGDKDSDGNRYFYLNRTNNLSTTSRNILKYRESSTDSVLECPQNLDMKNHTIVNQSDERLKQGIRELETPLEDISALRGVRFQWKENGREDVGVVAQEVETVLPEAVSTDEDGYKSVAYRKLIPLLVEAVKAQQEELDALREEVEALRRNRVR